MDAVAEIINAAEENKLGLTCDALIALGIHVEDIADVMDLDVDKVPSGQIFQAVALRDDKAVTCWAKREGNGFRCSTLNGPTWFVTAVYATRQEATEASDAQDHALDL